LRISQGLITALLSSACQVGIAHQDYRVPGAVCNRANYLAIEYRRKLHSEDRRPQLLYGLFGFRHFPGREPLEVSVGSANHCANRNRDRPDHDRHCRPELTAAFAGLRARVQAPEKSPGRPGSGSLAFAHRFAEQHIGQRAAVNEADRSQLRANRFRGRSRDGFAAWGCKDEACRQQRSQSASRAVAAMSGSSMLHTKSRTSMGAEPRCWIHARLPMKAGPTSWRVAGRNFDFCGARPKWLLVFWQIMA